MGYIIMIGQMILALSILVGLHEWGHFVTAKYFKTKVERFFLFFDPKFSLWEKKIGDTVYGIGWLPLGGYVKIAGMIDESMDSDQMKGEPQPWEFRSKPAWQKLIIMLGGVFVNAVLAVIIFAGLYMTYGEQKTPLESVKYGIYPSASAEKIGLVAGDKIVRIGGVVPESLEESMKEIVLSEVGSDLVLNRDGEEVKITLDQEKKKIILKSAQKGALFTLRMRALIGGIAEGSGAEVAGLKVNDEIIAINNQPIAFFDEIGDELKATNLEIIDVSVNRDGKIITVPVKLTIQTNEKTKESRKILGVGAMNQEQMLTEFTFDKKEYSLLEAIPAGVSRAKNELMNQLRSIRLISETKNYESVGSVFSITKMFGSTWNWQRFWTITGILSIWLAFLNLLPIPGLDGGHAVFALYEMIVGKPAPQKVVEVAQTIGVIFLMGLMALLLAWDGYKNFID